MPVVSLPQEGAEMKLDDAIVRLGTVNERLMGVWFEGDRDAIQLGIEALEDILRMRRVCEFDPTIMLPGETEE